MVDDSLCILCDGEITNYGNNPWPLTENGRCCDECNAHKVIPARLELVRTNNKEEK